MNFKKLFFRGAGSSSPVLEKLQAPAETELILRRERSRAERSGQVFSVLEFHVGTDRSPGSTAAVLAEICFERLRTTDTFGWFDPERIALVLPDTCARDAGKVAEEVRMRFPLEQEPPPCRVHTYPSDPVRAGAEENVRVLTAPVAPLQTSPPAQNAQAMEALFEQPMPLWKRSLDVTGALFGLVALLPVLAVAAVAVKCSSPGPVLFKQRRSGRGGKPFTIYKFRSMVVDAEVRKKDLMQHNEQDGPAFKITNDPRVTQVGRILRKLSIDELPQLWNVLRGDMSLVGPRPLPCHESEACLPWQRRRLDVKPGITCFWQIKSGMRIAFDDWVRMDIQYLRSLTPLQDIKLIGKTVTAVLGRKTSQ